MTKNNLEVVVTQRHINLGEEQDMETCAIALALTEMFPKSKVEVSADFISIKKKNGFEFSFEWNSLPTAVNRFIESFDRDKRKVKPFKFRLPFLNIG